MTVTNNKNKPKRKGKIEVVNTKSSAPWLKRIKHD